MTDTQSATPEGELDTTALPTSSDSDDDFAPKNVRPVPFRVFVCCRSTLTMEDWCDL